MGDYMKTFKAGDLVVYNTPIYEPGVTGYPAGRAIGVVSGFDSVWHHDGLMVTVLWYNHPHIGFTGNRVEYDPSELKLVEEFFE